MFWPVPKFSGDPSFVERWAANVCVRVREVVVKLSFGRDGAFSLPQMEMLAGFGLFLIAWDRGLDWEFDGMCDG
jgi:hypothetical protein